MAHKVCIDGTAYEIDGGKAMVDGAVYEIDHGVANVDGTAYEVGFAEMVTVKLKATGISNGYAWTIIDGVRYEGTEEVAVPIGTVITCYAKCDDMVSLWNAPCYIYVNGTRVAETDDGTISHALTVNTDITIKMMTGEGYDDHGELFEYGAIAIVENCNALASIATKVGSYASNYYDYAYLSFTDAYGTSVMVTSDGYAKNSDTGERIGGNVTFELPAGSTINCCVKSKNDYVSAYVKLNGTKVLTRSSSNSYGAYAYTVIGNATITLTTKSDKYGYIEITEQ